MWLMFLLKGKKPTAPVHVNRSPLRVRRTSGSKVGISFGFKFWTHPKESNERLRFV